MKLDPKIVPVLIVALITWGGIFLYLLRVDILTRKVQKEVERKTENEEPRA
mgnify:CR=1 FL=1